MNRNILIGVAALSLVSSLLIVWLYAGRNLITHETYSNVKDRISCKLEGQIQAKGFHEPVSTYRVIDFHENLEEDHRPIRASSEHMRLEVELERMSEEGRKEAIRTLRKTAESLDNSNNRKSSPD